MIEKLKSALGRTKNHLPVADGIHVSAIGALHLDGDSATLALTSGARHQISLTSMASGIAVSICSTPSPGGAELHTRREFPLVQASRAQEMFASTVSAWLQTLHGAVAGHSAGASRSRWPVFFGGLVVGGALLVAFSFVSAPPAAQFAAAPPAAAPAAGDASAALAAAAAQAARQMQQARLAPKDLERVVSSARIALRSGATPLVAFSDPNCPACQELEREAASLKPGVGFTIIPVAFQPGSRELVAKVLCAADPARAWADAIRGIAPKADACEAGLRKVDDNNALFADIGASATPTLVAGNGQLAQGSAQAAQLEVFASQYAN